MEDRTGLIAHRDGYFRHLDLYLHDSADVFSDRANVRMNKRVQVFLINYHLVYRRCRKKISLEKQDRFLDLHDWHRNILFLWNPCATVSLIFHYIRFLYWSTLKLLPGFFFFPVKALGISQRKVHMPCKMPFFSKCRAEMLYSNYIHRIDGG